MGERINKIMSNLKEKIAQKRREISFIYRVQIAINDWINSQWKKWCKQLIITLLMQVIIFTGLISYYFLSQTLSQTKIVRIDIAQAQAYGEKERMNGEVVPTISNNAGPEQSEEIPSEKSDPEALNSSQVVQTIQQVAKEKDFDWKLLVAITEQESGRCKNLIGDHGLSKGCYHIYYVNTCEYKQTETCIKDTDRLDVAKATAWTIERLNRHASLGYMEMIRSHNGLVADHSNDWYPKNIINIMKKI